MVGIRTVRRGQRAVAVTEVVAIVYCERQAVFTWRLGDRPTAVQAGCREEGERRHAEFARAAHDPASARPCWIASHVFGLQAPQTRVLRDWRDGVLVRYSIGRAVIAVYDRSAPRVLGLLCRSPALTRAVRGVLAWLVHRIERERAP